MTLQPKPPVSNACEHLFTLGWEADGWTTEYVEIIDEDEEIDFDDLDENLVLCLVMVSENREHEIIFTYSTCEILSTSNELPAGILAKVTQILGESQ